MNNLDYVIEPSKDGGYFAYFRCNAQCKTYAATLEEALDKLIENINVFFPSLADASAASHPACPAPITATSYSPAIYSLPFKFIVFPSFSSYLLQFSSFFYIIFCILSSSSVSRLFVSLFHIFHFRMKQDISF